MPARLVVYDALGMTLFSHAGCEEVMRDLVEGLAWASGWCQTWRVPSQPAISLARARPGPERSRPSGWQMADRAHDPLAGSDELRGDPRRLSAVPLSCCDLDDTLYDRTSAFATWAVKYASAHGADDDFAAWLVAEDEHGHRDRLQLFEAVRRRLDLGTGAVELVEQCRASFSAQARCMAEVLDALGRARAAGWRIAVVTNGHAVQQVKITAAGLDSLVDAVCVSEIEGRRKPDPYLLELAARRSGASLEGAWMIGDSAEADMGAAHAAGIDSVWLHLGRPGRSASFARSPRRRASPKRSTSCSKMGERHAGVDPGDSLRPCRSGPRHPPHDPVTGARLARPGVPAPRAPWSSVRRSSPPRRPLRRGLLRGGPDRPREPRDRQRQPTTWATPGCSLDETTPAGRRGQQNRTSTTRNALPGRPAAFSQCAGRGPRRAR